MKPVTREMLFTLIKYYYSVLRFLILDDISHFPQCFEVQFFTKVKISEHLADLRTKGITEPEEQLFQQIERMFALKTLPTKKIIGQMFTELRLMLTTEIDNIITSAARTVLEELEKSVIIGSIELCWDQWSDRFQMSARYMHKMSTSTCMGAPASVSIDDQFQIIYNNYDTYLQGGKNGEEKGTLSDTIQDTNCIDRWKHTPVKHTPVKRF